MQVFVSCDANYLQERSGKITADGEKPNSSENIIIRQGESLTRYDASSSLYLLFSFSFFLSDVFSNFSVWI